MEKDTQESAEEKAADAMERAFDGELAKYRSALIEVLKQDIVRPTDYRYQRIAAEALGVNLPLSRNARRTLGLDVDEAETVT